ncbi:choice-of-anchor L domain-containing protein [Crocinitomicaceae bacterium CZZ-1]|uniref:Choice-of-anchor L domain-containing protein n=1 Tax=Taishania pollutisoli TaxID=2766479 RepID=A0A8J6TY93_9FLAO|nr:choice-of-anchor L domain-containing protein [Taishania pollutisoli]MBC9813706.1 choice-of-anchor L domain-containing protein [Taishania pollutisoli]
MTKLITRITTVGLALFYSFGINAQTTITYQNTMNPNDLVQNVLLGFGVTASNVTFNNDPGTMMQGNARSFTATNFPYSQGVYIRTLGGDDVSSDSDLNAISTNDITNGGILEFDFVAAGNNLSFNYMFASEEYPDYVCSEFNDVFGFFISGPGINGPYSNNAENIALIPNTNIPVAINTVNSGTPGIFGTAFDCAAQDPNWQSNSVYYTTQYATYSGEGYNGGTVSLPSEITLQCGETYHIKIAVANVGDGALDSGVYLEANSFVSDAVQVVVATVTGDTTVFEGCTDASIYFIRPQSQINDTLTIDYTIGGTATMGTDYNNLPNPITFLPGQDTIIVTITPIADGIPDNNETITITAQIVNACGDTITSTGTLIILDSVDLTLTYTNPTVFCINDSVPVPVIASGGFGPYTYEWSNGAVGDTAYLATVDSVQGTIEYYVTATDACGYTGTDTVLVTVDQSLVIDSILSTPATCLPIGTVATQTFPYGAHLQNPGNQNSYDLTFDWTYEHDTTFIFPNQSSLNNLSGGWYYLELTDNVANCTVNDSVFVDVVDVPFASVTAEPGAGCTPLEVTFSNSSQNSNQYFWDFGNGNGTVTNDLSSVNQTFDVTSIVQLVASNGDVNCNDTTTILVEIVTCGCTDPIAINYNMAAVIDDGSCIYPNPTVTAPNVITLNGDNVNDVFFLTTEYAASIELIIVDRWGNVVYSGVGNQTTPPTWNGRNASGKMVSDGVYFYKYTIGGILGEVLEGHGFLTVVK